MEQCLVVHPEESFINKYKNEINVDAVTKFWMNYKKNGS